MVPAAGQGQEQWYAVQTRARHEKLVTHRFQERGITSFLPLVREVHRWSDRKTIVELPLFSCYVFAKIEPTNVDRLRVLKVEGVISLVGTHGEGTPIPEEQIQSVRMVAEQKMQWSAHPFLKIGQRVRVCGGALDGMEGILLSSYGDRSLVVSIDSIQRSIAVRLEGYEVQAV
jgi:transcription antitermination factor NusG